MNTAMPTAAARMGATPIAQGRFAAHDDGAAFDGLAVHDSSHRGTTDRRPGEARDALEAKAEAKDRRRLQADLKLATAAGDFVLHYQPRVSLATGAVVGAEALIRWPHRKRGLMPPDRFIQIAEQIGLIGAIGAWALRVGCAEAVTWPAAMQPVLSVNVSARQLRANDFASHVAFALEASALPPERLELELTESMLIAVDTDILFMLSALRDMGVGLSLDDFGTGYASLAMLRRIPLTTLKIDRTLVRNLPRNQEDVAIVRAMVETCHAIGLSVTAEGVECESQRDCLVRIGADDGQGYLFGRPVPAERMRERLAD